MDEVRFRPDLYRGTAQYYDRYRLGYPKRLFDDLIARAGLSGTGRLIDLACGTGQVAFGLCSHFAEVWAVDQEPEMVAHGQARAERAGVRNIRWITGRAEDLAVEGTVELVTIGNAFHRLDRRRVASAVARWLGPGGHLALLWTSTPWEGQRDWQHELSRVYERWMNDATTDRVPAAFEAAMAAMPHRAVLEGAGLEWLGKFEFRALTTWTVASLTGWLFSTSILSRAALGRHAAAFEQDLHDRLLAVCPSGTFEDDVSFAYELAASR